MNIVIVNDAASLIGGAERVALNSARELASRGHKVTYFAAIGPPDRSIEGVPNLTVRVLGQHTTNSAPTKPEKLAAYLRFVWNRTAAAELKSMLNDFDRQDTVVHMHCYATLLSASCVSAALASGHPFVMTMHDYGIACPLRNFYHVRERAVCKRKPMGISCLTVNCTPKSFRTKLGYIIGHGVHDVIGRVRSRIPNVIYVSEFSAQIIRPLLHSKVREFFVRNPCEVEHSEPVQVATNRSFSFSGRLVPEKDPLTLARAARIANVPCLFIGDGPERETILRENPDAEITGWVDGDTVSSHLRRSRAFVIPSIWYECSPVSTIEAQAIGLPVIASSTNASRDQIIDGETGLIFESGDPESLAAKIGLLKDDDMVSSMGRASFDSYWRNPPTLAAHADELIRVYGQLF